MKASRILKISPDVLEELEALAAVGVAKTPAAVVKSLIREFEKAHPETADSARVYRELLARIPETPEIDYIKERREN